jgi:hypothetical protein
VTSQLALLLLLLTTPSTPETLDSLGHAPPSMVERLRAECVGKRNRITTELARYDVRVRRLDGVGLGGFKTIGPSPHPPDPVAWSSVTRVGVVHTKSLLGMGIGVAFGGTLAFALGADPTALVTTALAGGLVGEQVGCRITREEPAYVAKPRTASRPAAATTPVATTPAVAPAGIYEKRVQKASGQIHHNRLLRVTFRDLTQVEGYALNADRDGLHSLQPKKRTGSAGSLPDPIPWARILQIEKHGGSAGKGALAGATIVGTTGAIFGAALVAGGGIGGGSGGGGGEVLGGAALGALVGGAIGAGLGAAFGAPIPRWHIVY